MKILVVSDSHRINENLREVLNKINSSISRVLHLGDCHDDIMEFQKEYSHIQFESVRGNCDFGNKCSEEKTVSVMNKTIFMTHGHSLGVKSNYKRITNTALGKGVDVCLFGHTHYPIVFEESGIIFMNPGSISFPRDTKFPSYGVLDIEESGVITPRIVIKEGNIYRTYEFF